jgi:tetratricopeptide (TPR) repeat protein
VPDTKCQVSGSGTATRAANSEPEGKLSYPFLSNGDSDVSPLTRQLNFYHPAALYDNIKSRPPYGSIFEHFPYAEIWTNSVISNKITIAVISFFRKFFDNCNGSPQNGTPLQNPRPEARLAEPVRRDTPRKEVSELYKMGDVIGGKYKVVRKLGEGGFGTVLLVKMQPEDWLIALKITRPDLELTADVLQRFKKEASIWMNLDNHPNIVRFHFFEDMAGQMVLAMEYIKPDAAGRVTLADHFRHKISLRQLVYWARDISKGMSHAFSKGLKAHRDLKPANILISDFLKELIGGVAKVSDFGLAGHVTPQSAAHQHSSASRIGVTIAGEISGTPTYMAPEQFLGLTHCSEKSDIYSFGLILYEGVNNGNLPVRPSPHCRNAAEMWADLARQHRQVNFQKLNSPLWPIIERCIKKNPSDRFASFAEITALLEKLLVNHFDAIPLELASQENSDDLSNKAASLSQLGDHVAALEQIEEALRLAPTNVTCLTNKANILFAAGRLEEAVKVCYTSLKQDQSHVNTWITLGLCLCELNRPMEAVSTYRKALELDSTSHVAWANLGNCLMNSGKIEDALQSFKKAVALAPDIAAYHVNLGLALRKIERIPEARTCFKKALELHPANVDAHSSLGDCYLFENNFRDAAKHYRNAIDIDSKSGMAWHNLGNVHDRVGQYEEALACFREAVKHNPEQFDSWKRMGNIHKQAAHTTDAVACFRNCTNINPNAEEGWIDLGAALLLSGKVADATESFIAALSINGKNFQAWFYLGQLFERAGWHGDAREAFSRVAEYSDPHDKAITDAVAYAQSQISKLPKHTGELAFDWNSWPRSC